MHNKLIPTTEKLVNKQKNNLLYEEIINSDLKKILVSKEEQENLIDFLKKRKQIGENYLQINLLHLLDDKQTFDEQGIENNIRSCLNLQEKILPVAWDKKKIRQKRIIQVVRWVLVIPLVFVVCFLLFYYYMYGIDLGKLVSILSLTLFVFFCTAIVLDAILNPKNKLRDWWNRIKLKIFKPESIELTVGFKNFGVKTNFRPSKPGKKQNFIQYLIKELLIGKTNVIVLDLDDYPPSYLSNLLTYFKNIAEIYNKTNSKKLTFFYLTSKDILNEYNQFDFYIYPILETNELVLKKTLENNYEMVNTLFSNFKNKFDLPIYEDTYSFLIDYKKFYKTYKNHFSLKEFFVILILKKYFYKYLQFLITNEKDPNNTIDLLTFKTIINLKKDNSTQSQVLGSYNDIWKWAYSNSYFQIESENQIDFYSIFLTFFVIKLFEFTNLNNECSCLEKYLFAVYEIINNKLATCIENKITDEDLDESKITDEDLKLFIQENIGEGEKYNNFLNMVKEVAKNLHFSNNLLDSKDDYYKSLIKWIEEFVYYIPELENIYTNTLIKYHTNNNDHYIFILASFLNQIFKSKEIKTNWVYLIIFEVLQRAKSNYYLKLKNIFFLLDKELQVYIIELITKNWWPLDLLFVNDWLAVFSENERQAFGILLKHYRYKKYWLKPWKNSWKEKRFGRIEYYNLIKFRTLISLDKKVNKFALDKWFERYHCIE